MRFLAVSFFTVSLSMAQGTLQQHLDLANGYLRNYIPGVDSTENQALARQAEGEYLRVLELSGNQLEALSALATLHLQQAQSINTDLDEKTHRLEEAKGWYQRLVRADPQNKEGFYALGVIEWLEVYPRVVQARSQIGMKPEDPAPLNQDAIRYALRLQWGTAVEEGLRNLQSALQIDPSYDDAMAYMNLLYRMRADIANSAEEAAQDLATADQWVQKALDTKKAKAMSTSPTRTAIRVTGNVQGAKLLHMVPAIYPAAARDAHIEGRVEFTAVIDKSGHVTNIQLVSGHPLLVGAAQDAVSQWIYQPTLVNGQPMEVVTQIHVDFGNPTEGNMVMAPPPPPPPPPQQSNSQRIRIAGIVQAANLVNQVPPVYPPLARQARLQGTVRFNAVIDKEGHVINLQLVRGHPLLVTAAQDAAMRWLYRPVLLNGEPVEVMTEIDVNFLLP